MAKEFFCNVSQKNKVKSIFTKGSKNMKKFTTRFLTVFLAIAMLIVSLPMGVFAEELREAMAAQKENGSNENSVGTVGNENEAEEPYALGEDISIRSRTDLMTVLGTIPCSLL